MFALLVGPGWWRGMLPTGRVLVMAVAYAVICVAPTAAFALAYALHGGLDAFVEGT